MNCEEVAELLSPYQDRELTPEEAAAIAGHLEDCPECAKRSTIFGQLSQVIKHWEGVKSSEEARRELIRKVRESDRQGGTGRKAGPLATTILGFLAAGLLGAGVVALIFSLSGGDGDGKNGENGPENGVKMSAAARLTAVTGRVEVVHQGAPVDVRGPREVAAGREIRCTRGSAAQVEIPAAKEPRTRLVLRGVGGPGSLRLAAEGLKLGGGRLVFHLSARSDGSLEPLAAAGSWTVMVSSEGTGTVGLVELGDDGSVRLAVLGGSASLTSGPGAAGLPVKAGTQISVDAGGKLSGPDEIKDRTEFELLAGKGESHGADD